MRYGTLAFGVLAALLTMNAASSAAPDQSTPEACALIDESPHRLLCYDALYRIGRVVTKSPDVPRNWTVRTEISRIDDTRSVFLSTRALDTYADDYGAQRSPTLTLRCMENTTALVMNFDGDYMSDSRMYGPVTFRVDESPARDYQMDASTDHHAVGLWRGGSSIPAIKTMLDAKRLLVRAIPVNSSAVTVGFDISGLADIIGPLREACSW